MRRAGAAACWIALGVLTGAGARALAQAPGAAPDRAPAIERHWLPLAEDGIHDPRSPGIKLKQPPAEALSVLPADTAGNQVRWVKALESGAINPRTSLRPEARFEVRNDEIIVSKFGSMPAVVFPHRPHTLWLDCSNCHEKLFVSKAGANKFSMLRILDGEQCGLCHGAVAFPLTECLRCHSLPNEKLLQMLRSRR